MSRAIIQKFLVYTATIAAIAGGDLSNGAVHADPLGPRGIFDPLGIFEPIKPPASEYDQMLPNAGNVEVTDDVAKTPAHLRRQVVAYSTRETPGTIVIDTRNTYLYYVLGNNRAIRYGIGVGRDGFTWSGTRVIDRKQEWPDWTPPPEMIVRQPYLPRFMAGGPGNPLGARAMYLSGTLYRIHGTSEPSSIGKHVSSGCIRLLNEDVIDLYDRTPIGTKVVVLPEAHHREPVTVGSVPGMIQEQTSALSMLRAVEPLSYGSEHDFSQVD